MQRDLKVYLWDLQKALGEIETFTKGKDLHAYGTERMLQAAVERNFITVGEVLSRILHHFPESKTRIDHARKIANFRNILVHEYSTIHDAEVWRIISESVPTLKREVQSWLAELDAEQP